FGGSSSARPLQHFEDRCGLAAIFGRARPLCALGPFGCFLGWGGLLPRLGLPGRNVRALVRNSGLLVALLLLLGSRLSGARFFAHERTHAGFSLAVVSAIT